MADTTISQLGQIPSLVGNASLPISDGTNTYRTTISQLTSYNLPVIEATGGTVTTITERGIRYKIHTFTTVGTSSFIVNTAINNPTVEILLVGGGGGGGGDLGGGGGAGGVYYDKSAPVTVGNKTVVVGAGGTGGGTTRQVNTLGTNGGNSQFDIYAVAGGGRGGTWWNNSAAYHVGGNGGCGGGAGSVSGIAFPLGGTGTQGTFGVLGGNGGQAANESWGHATGGGGGAGGNGEDARYYSPGMGGVGICCDISGIATFYAGGGSGSIYNTTVNYASKVPGGGGRGGTRYDSDTLIRGENGINGLGGGGGGGSYSSVPGGGGNGGSGIVIVRYPVY